MLVNTSGPEVSPSRDHRRYVLMTAAYNEEANLEGTIRSVLSQTRLPERWLIISDGSTDRTDDIITKYASQYPFIRFLRVVRAPGHSFASKVVALKEGIRLLENVPHDFIGNIDADVTVEPSYFEDLITRLKESPRLGLVSGFVYEEKAGQFRNRSSNRTGSVPHAAQLVRRECYEAIGGYAVLKYGGEDWYAQISAGMKGWSVEAIPELRIFHRRHTGAGRNLLGHRFRLGRLDYSFGSDPLFEVLKCLQRIPESPFFLGGITRLAGFTWSCLCGEQRPVSDEFTTFLRSEQRLKVSALFSNLKLQGSWSSAPRSSKGVPLE